VVVHLDAGIPEWSKTLGRDQAAAFAEKPAMLLGEAALLGSRETRCTFPAEMLDPL
jgi:hypothetical protein